MLFQYLQEKNLLLILDNCEHLIDACAHLVNFLLLQCLKISVLATCRETLDIDGEAIYRLPSLSNLDPARTADLHELEKTDSVRLFTERAAAILPGFRLTSQNLPEVARICYRLDGIPLAIELAAAGMSALSAAEIADRLDDRFRLLIIGNRTALPRHRTLRASIDWSYNLLPQAERLLMQRLSIFAGGWTLEAAEGACAWDGLEQQDIVDALTGLVKKSLIQTVSFADSVNRFRMLETVRQYAQEKLSETGQVSEARDHHQAYFLILVEKLEPGLRGRELIQTLDRLELELDNLRLALEWGLQTNVEAELRLAAALLWFWHVHNRDSEGSEWLKRGLATAQEDCIASKEPNQLPNHGVHPRVRVKAMCALGFLEIQMDRPDISKVILNQSLELYRQSGIDCPQELAFVLLYLGDCERLENNLIQARTLVNDALSIFQEIMDHHAMAGCWQIIGYLETDLVQKKKIHQEELRNAEASGDEDKIATALLNLGLAEWYLCEYEKANEYFLVGRQHFLKVRNYLSAAFMLLLCSKLAVWTGEFQHAMQLLDQATVFYQENNCPEVYFYLFLVLRGDPIFAQGVPSEIQHYLDELRAYSKKTGNMETLAYSFYLQARLERNQGDIEQAKLYALESLKIGREEKLPYQIVNALDELGNLAGMEGDLPTAVSQLRESLKVSDQLKKTDCAKPFASLTSLAVRQDEMERAARLFGAFDRQFPGFSNFLSQVERAQCEADLAAVRDALGTVWFNRLYEEGRAMTFEQAVALALEENE
jgi:predicted ATPase